MRAIEIFQSEDLPCRVGKVRTRVLVGGDRRRRGHDTTRGYVRNKCSGCQRWSSGEMREIRREIEEVWGKGGLDGREENFEVLVVEERISGGRSRFVGYCSPMGSWVENLPKRRCQLGGRQRRRRLLGR